MFDHKQKQDRPARGGRGDWDGPRTNEQPSWNRGSVGDGGYNQGPGWGGGYGGPGPAPQVKNFPFHLSKCKNSIILIIS